MTDLTERLIRDKPRHAMERDHPNATAAYDALEKVINRFVDDDRIALQELLLRDHRALVQTTAAFCVDFLLRLADEPYGSDPRNEAAVKTAKLIKEALKDEYHGRFPCI